MKWLFVLVTVPLISLAEVGTITEQTGLEAEIQRQNSTMDAGIGTGIAMNDILSTSRTRLAITFVDDTKVQLTEQSRLEIDDFVYDPNQGTGRMAMNVAMGTVRMASGATARNSRENVRIRTPTATISVRGTDFTMTVDEIGRSLVILLPTCPDPDDPDACWTGSIEVSTDAGYVLLNQAYQATLVNSSQATPSEPKLIEVEESLIDNMLILSPPRGLLESSSDATDQNEESELDRDLLEYNDLTKDFLEEDLLKISELDVNVLGIDFLDNLLDVTSEIDQDMFEIDPVLPTVNMFPWVLWAYNEEVIFLFSERPPHVAEVVTDREAEGIINIVQDGIPAKIQLNDGGTSVVINIVQNQ